MFISHASEAEAQRYNRFGLLISPANAYRRRRLTNGGTATGSTHESIPSHRVLTQNNGTAASGHRSKTSPPKQDMSGGRKTKGNTSLVGRQTLPGNVSQICLPNGTCVPTNGSSSSGSTPRPRPLLNAIRRRFSRRPGGSTRRPLFSRRPTVAGNRRG